MVVPVERRQQLLQLVHTALGHNVHGMFKELRRAFYWKTMRADAKDFAARCKANKEPHSPSTRALASSSA